MNNNIPFNIKQLRKNKKINQQRLADLIGVHKNTVSRWERGIESPTAHNLVLIANALEASLSDFENNHIDRIKKSNAKYAPNSCQADPICKKVCNACMGPNDPDIKGVLSAVVDILQSGNKTISAALKMNVKAFHEASQDKKMLKSIRSPNGRDTEAKGK